MTDEPLAGIEDLMPEQEECRYASLIVCQGCGESGTMYSTAEPPEETVWTCEACGEETVHETCLRTADGWRLSESR